MASQPTVYVVDDDPQLRESLELLIRSAGLNVEGFASAEEFLAKRDCETEGPVCLVLDIRMPGLSGLGLQKELAAAGADLPTIVISGYADVPTAVEAMGAGALDVIEKPFNRQAVMQRIREALDRSAQLLRDRGRRGEITARISKLSPREREVMELLVAGKSAKIIAAKFGIGEKTVLKHRSRVMEKMRVESIAELVRIALGVRDAPGRPRPAFDLSL